MRAFISPHGGTRDRLFIIRRNACRLPPYAGYDAPIDQLKWKVPLVARLIRPTACLWTLSKDDADYSIRWRNIKRAFIQQIAPDDRPAVFASRRHKGEQAIWQRRFWEHRIRDDEDFSRHIDYIHYNPVKHGYVKRPTDWAYTSIHRYIRQGVLPVTWGSDIIVMPDGVGYE